MSKRDVYLEMFDTIESIFSHPGLLGFTPLVNDLRGVMNTEAGYPPRNIIKTSDDSWILEAAVAGFSPNEIHVEVHDGHLHINGVSSLAEEASNEYIHRGIARRNFSFSIRLGEHVKVSEEYPPFMQHGMLVINLAREIPESEKPKRFYVIDVNANGAEVENTDPSVDALG